MCHTAKTKVSKFFMRSAVREPLFFVHSYLTSMALWQTQIEHFSKSYQVIAMDLRGHGQSAISQPHSLYDMVDDACAVLDAAGIERVLVRFINRGHDRCALRLPSHTV